MLNLVALKEPTRLHRLKYVLIRMFTAFVERLPMCICVFSTTDFADSGNKISPTHYLISVDTHSDQVGTKALRQACKLIYYSVRIIGII